MTVKRAVEKREPHGPWTLRAAPTPRLPPCSVLPSPSVRPRRGLEFRPARVGVAPSVPSIARWAGPLSRCPVSKNSSEPAAFGLSLSAQANGRRGIKTRALAGHHRKRVAMLHDRIVLALAVIGGVEAAAVLIVAMLIALASLM